MQGRRNSLWNDVAGILSIGLGAFALFISCAFILISAVAALDDKGPAMETWQYMRLVVLALGCIAFMIAIITKSVSRDRNENARKGVTMSVMALLGFGVGHMVLIGMVFLMIIGSGAHP